MDDNCIRAHICDIVKQELLPLLKMFRPTQNSAEQEYFSIEETAFITGLSGKHIRRAIKRGELLCSNMGGSRRPTYRIAKKDIAAWVEQHRLKHGPSKSERQALVRECFGKKRV
jgi:excisionase family DNA binding protein